MLRQNLSVNNLGKGTWCWLGLLLLAGVVLATLVVGQIVNAQNGEANTYERFCFEGRTTGNISPAQITKLYLTETNQFFNQNVAEVMDNKLQKDLAPTISFDTFKNSKYQGMCSDGDLVCQALMLCKDNNSTYCMAVNTTGFTKQHFDRFKQLDVLDQNFRYLKYSYFCYHEMMRQKLEDIRNNSGLYLLEQCTDKDKATRNQQITAYEELAKGSEDKKEVLELKKAIKIWQNHNLLCELQVQFEKEQNPGLKEKLRLQMNPYFYSLGTAPGAAQPQGVFNFANTYSTQAQQLVEELDVAKKVLDSTLATYNELQNAWRLHIKYLDIFQSLVTMRDKLSNIRRRTDLFPSRFIDATTTKCQ